MKENLPGMSEIGHNLIIPLQTQFHLILIHKVRFHMLLELLEFARGAVDFATHRAHLVQHISQTLLFQEINAIGLNVARPRLWRHSRWTRWLGNWRGD